MIHRAYVLDQKRGVGLYGLQDYIAVENLNKDSKNL